MSEVFLQVKEEKMSVNDVLGFDVVISTGEGKPRQLDARTTVFKRDLEEKYSLKMKASRAFFSEVAKVTRIRLCSVPTNLLLSMPAHARR